MRIDLRCPAEIFGAEILREEAGIRLTLMNLSDRDVDSCEATVRVLDREGKETARTVHRSRALKGRPHSVFSMEVPLEIPEESVRAEAQLDKVWFEDHDVWRKNPSAETEYEPNQLPPGNELNALRYVAGHGAVGFPSQQAGLWVCVCGRPNGNGDMICARCRRQREMIFQQYNPAAVMRQISQRERQLDLETRGAREESASLQRAREEEYHRKGARAKRRLQLGIALAAALALTAAFHFAGEPALRLWSGDRALQEDRLEDARAVLTGLGSFPGAERRLAEADLRIARRDGALAAAGEGSLSREQMAAVSSRLRQADAVSEDRALADRVDLALSRSLLEAGDLDGAEKVLAALPEDLEGRAEALAGCTYARGEAAMDARDYEAARAYFLSLDNYRDAPERAKEALYHLGLVLMEAGEYEQAMDAFAGLPGYQDADSLIPQCWYLKGLVLEAAGESEEARLAYLEAGSYEDAASRALEIRWAQAEALYAAEDYEAALPLYREMDGYQDARAKWIECAEILAGIAHRQREYTMAISWLEDLPEETRTVQQIRTRAYYLGARAAANRGELAEAIEMMEHVPTYGDASSSIRKWRIALAEQKMDEGLYEEARELLTPVSENYQAAQLLKQVEKALAEREEAAETETEETAAPEGSAD
ncbi:MAG: hypothetical protein II888_00355 [Clostridia bacterium]|nr:hypothetical protein [Clostridia bacterium]